MRAMVIDAYGGPERFREADLPMPVPDGGDVLVRIACAGVNPADWKAREGMLSRYIAYHFPFVLGFDLAGIVQSVGPGVTGLAPGDAVFGTSKQGSGGDGSYAEYAIADPSMLQPLPPGLGFAQAAALPTAGSTAFGALVDVGQVKAGQRVLINGGAGGVGSIAIQIARARGADVMVTCSPANADYVAMLGAESAIDYRGGVDAIVAAVRDRAPDGVDLVIDAVGMGSLSGAAGRLVASGGRYVEIETLFPEADEAARSAATENGVDIVSNMTAIARLPQHLAGLAAMAGDGTIRVPEIEIMPLAKVAEAHARVQGGHVRGKIVLEVADLPTR